MKATPAWIPVECLLYDVFVESEPLYENEFYDPILVEQTMSGRYAVVDGMHRSAGLVAAGASKARCIIVYDEDLIADAAEPGGEQANAIEEIYDDVGYDPLWPDWSIWDETDIEC